MRSLKITKIRVAFLVLVVIALLILAGFVYMVILQYVSSLPKTTVIEGNTYSDRPTPYGFFFMQDANGTYSHVYWRLTPNETLPSNSVGIIQWTPIGPVTVIYGMTYSRVPTNFTEFTVPWATEPYWTLYPNQPLPINATLVLTIGDIDLGLLLTIMGVIEILLFLVVALTLAFNRRKRQKS